MTSDIHEGETKSPIDDTRAAADKGEDNRADEKDDKGDDETIQVQKVTTD